MFHLNSVKKAEVCPSGSNLLIEILCNNNNIYIYILYIKQTNKKKNVYCCVLHSIFKYQGEVHFMTHFRIRLRFESNYFC